MRFTCTHACAPESTAAHAAFVIASSTLLAHQVVGVLPPAEDEEPSKEKETTDDAPVENTNGAVHERPRNLRVGNSAVSFRRDHMEVTHAVALHCSYKDELMRWLRVK